jgi:hypothetical protein
MIYCKNNTTIAYPSTSPIGWVASVSPSFDNSGLIGVVCDDQALAFNELAPLLFAKNNKIISIDSENSTMNYDEIDKDIPQYTDQMYDYIWREHCERTKGYYNSPRNVPDIFNFEYLDNQTRIQDFIGVVFIEISSRIKCLDVLASQIAYDYTASIGDNSNLRHKELRNVMSKYYIYNQEEERIYDFMEFQR